MRRLERRYSSGLTLNAACTWRQSINNIAELFGGPAGDIQQTTSVNASRANGFDVWQSLVISAP